MTEAPHGSASEIQRLQGGLLTLPHVESFDALSDFRGVDNYYSSLVHSCNSYRRSSCADTRCRCTKDHSYDSLFLFNPW